MNRFSCLLMALIFFPFNIAPVSENHITSLSFQERFIATIHSYVHRIKNNDNYLQQKIFIATALLATTTIPLLYYTFFFRKTSAPTQQHDTPASTSEESLPVQNQSLNDIIGNPPSCIPQTVTYTDPLTQTTKTATTFTPTVLSPLSAPPEKSTLMPENQSPFEAFAAAVKAYDCEKIKKLLASNPSINVNAPIDTDGNTSLHWAAINGSFDLVTLLVTHGALANRESNNGNTPLSIAKQTLRSIKRCTRTKAETYAIIEFLEKGGNTQSH